MLGRVSHDVIQEIDARRDAAHNLLLGNVLGGAVAALGGDDQGKVIVIKDLAELLEGRVERHGAELAVDDLGHGVCAGDALREQLREDLVGASEGADTFANKDARFLP